MKKKPAKKNVRWVAVSGGFDPLHIGHVRLMREAKKLGDALVVIINNDNWLHNKKGFVFMPQKERIEIIRAFPFVDRVVLTDHSPLDPDRSVVRSLRALRPAFFANGGDRKPSGDPIPEDVVCDELGIKIVYNVGRGGKVQSSSWMTRHASRAIARSVRPWGEFYGWDGGDTWYLKTLYVLPKKRLSLQYHHHRSEVWVLVSGDATATIGASEKKLKRIPLKHGDIFHVPQGHIHRLESKKGGTLVEIAHGKFDENDIVRLQDDHGRIESLRR
jgi:D-beta-D-heptose 7-phosphate kinase/D-beta-D-heptose 1-phosphate adenosyltransferase